MAGNLSGSLNGIFLFVSRYLIKYNNVCAREGSCLPQLQTLALWNEQLVTLFYVERLIPSVNVRQCAVHTPSAQRVRVNLYAVAYFLLGDIVCPYPRISQEEALSGSEIVLVLQFLALRGVKESIVSHLQSSVVSQVLTQSETTIGVQIGQHLDIGEEIGIHVRTLLEAFGIASCPPVTHIAVGVILAALVIEAVCHLVAYHYTDSAIVEGLVCLRIKERILQDTCGETNLVGSGVVIGVYRLGIHEPLIAVYGLASLLLYVLVVSEFTASHHVLVVRLGWVYDKR